jgi:hypothetical protein
VAVSALARWAGRLAVCVVVAAVSSCSTWAWMTTRPRTAVPLTAGLSGKWEDLSNEFDRRVKADFPIGIPVEKMGAELQRQGFSRQDWSSSIETEHAAVRREDNGVCNQAAYVHWHADGEGRLTAARGVYREEGCL